MPSNHVEFFQQKKKYCRSSDNKGLEFSSIYDDLSSISSFFKFRFKYKSLGIKNVSKHHVRYSSSIWIPYCFAFRQMVAWLTPKAAAAFRVVPYSSMVF